MPKEKSGATRPAKEKKHQPKPMTLPELEKLHDKIDAKITELGPRAAMVAEELASLSEQQKQVEKVIQAETKARESRQEEKLRQLETGNLPEENSTFQMTGQLRHARVPSLRVQQHQLEKKIDEQKAIQKRIKQQRNQLLDDILKVKQAISLTKINELVQKYWASAKTNSVLKKHALPAEINSALQWVYYFDIEKIPSEHRQMCRVFNAFQTLRDILEDPGLLKSNKLTKLQETMEQFKNTLQNPFPDPGFMGVFFAQKSTKHIKLAQTIQEILDQHPFSARADESAAAGSARMQSPRGR